MSPRLAVTALLALLVLVAPAAATANTFYGKVGPSRTITLERADGTTVRHVGTGRHTFVIRDRSSSHNFHLLGPGVDRKTGVGFTGRRRWTVMVQAGTYRYRCDPHAGSMRGSFTAG